jgi:hypothetical protein
MNFLCQNKHVMMMFAEGLQFSMTLHAIRSGRIIMTLHVETVESNVPLDATKFTKPVSAPKKAPARQQQ